MITAAGWKEAYAQFVADGWNSLSCPAEFGGQNLPRALVGAGRGDVERRQHGLCAVPDAHARCDRGDRAARVASAKGGLPAEDGLRRVDRHHEFDRASGRFRPVGRAHAGRADRRRSLHARRVRRSSSPTASTIWPSNIIHMVLARIARCARGRQGHFTVPRAEVLGARGRFARRAQRRALHLGRAQARHPRESNVRSRLSDRTAVPSAELIGEENRGLEYMFIMMNAARYSVGLEGVGISERAFQTALTYAQERIQGTEIGARGGARVPIVRHPDVRRMLMLHEIADRSDASARRRRRRLPGCRPSASGRDGAPPPSGICRLDDSRRQGLVHREFGRNRLTRRAGARRRGIRRGDRSGAAVLRDARITPIYEGTTGIQANDLIGRKLARDGGDAARVVIAQMRAIARRAREERRASRASPPCSRTPSMRSSVRSAMWPPTTTPTFAASPSVQFRCSSCSVSWRQAGSCCARR